MSLLQNLKDLLPAEHLALMKSVEMIWELGQVARPPSDEDLSTDKRFSGWYTFISLLDDIPSALPNLRYLHCSLSGQWYPPQMAPNDVVRRSKFDVLGPVGDMVRKYFATNSMLEEVNVGLPAMLWLARLGADSRATQTFEKSHVPGEISNRIWHSLGCIENQSGQESITPGFWTRLASWKGDFDHHLVCCE